VSLDRGGRERRGLQRGSQRGWLRKGSDRSGIGFGVGSGCLGIHRMGTDGMVFTCIMHLCEGVLFEGWAFRGVAGTWSSRFAGFGVNAQVHDTRLRRPPATGLDIH
jgi:hypothetical protein